MATYAFFEPLVTERRRYRFEGGSEIEFLSRPNLRSRIRIERETPTYMEATVSHILGPPTPIGVAQVNERLNVTLPEDFDLFHRRWGAGVLIFRELYHLMSPQEMIEETLSLRRLRGQAADPAVTPVRVVRFAHWRDGHDFAFRSVDGVNWEVFLAVYGYDERALFEESFDIAGDAGEVTDASFADWLRRLCESDGFPPGRGFDAGEPMTFRLHL